MCTERKATGDYVLACFMFATMQWVSFNRMLSRRQTKPHLFTCISFHKKALSTLNIYKIVIRLKSQVLSKEDSRLVADRQTCNQFFCSSSKPLEHWTARSLPELPW